MGNYRSSAAGWPARVNLTFVAALVAALGGLACLTGCPTVDLGDTPTEIGLCNPAGGLAYFQDQIWPNYVLRNNAATSCAQNGCHVAGGNGLDFPAQVDYPAAYRRSQLYLNCGTPEASLFLTKPLAGIDAHSGGDIFASDSDPAVQIFLAWFK
ncbi:MAG TPA: hypothetical protein VFT22_22910 [Kofleriaceae bacterium]|nr:hypothetical protein [Kofleriaceae bacterium]